MRMLSDPDTSAGRAAQVRKAPLKSAVFHSAQVRFHQVLKIEPAGPFRRSEGRQGIRRSVAGRIFFGCGSVMTDMRDSGRRNIRARNHPLV